MKATLVRRAGTSLRSSLDGSRLSSRTGSTHSLCARARPTLQRCHSKPTANQRLFSSTSLTYQQSATDIATRPVPTTRTVATAPPMTSTSTSEPMRSLTEGLSDEPMVLDESSRQVDWSRSFHGLSDAPFSKEAQDILQQPIPTGDIEVKPDGIVYLPEIKYRRILNKAFGPGGWGLAPRGETIVTPKSVTREYGMVVMGRLVSIARGEQAYFDPEGIPTAAEGCKSNALVRCCKDLGIASELWDPRYVRKFVAENAKEMWVEHVVTRKRKKITIRKDDEPRYPFKEVKQVGAA